MSNSLDAVALAVFVTLMITGIPLLVIGLTVGWKHILPKPPPQRGIWTGHYGAATFGGQSRRLDRAIRIFAEHLRRELKTPVERLNNALDDLWRGERR